MSDDSKPNGAVLVEFDSIPLAAVLVRNGTIAAVNRAYLELMGFEASQIVGHSVTALIERDVVPGEAPELIDRARRARDNEREFTLRTSDASGRTRHLRVETRPGHEPGTSVAFLVDREQDLHIQLLGEAIARVGASLAGASSEDEVLGRVARALVSKGFAATIVLVEPDTDRLVLAHSESLLPPEVHRAVTEVAAKALPAAHTLWTKNPGYLEGRAHFFEQYDALLERAFPSEAAETIRKTRPGRVVASVPLLLAGAPYGLLCMTGDDLNPALSGPLEMLAKLTMQAIEAVRMQRELVERERLAALGEAAAVMAHEVRNPVAAMLNAVTLLSRGTSGSDELLRMVAEEARRLDRIVSNLLTLGRPISPELRPVDPMLVARGAADVLASRDAIGGVTVEFRPPLRRTLVIADPNLIQLAVLNVLRNAAQAVAGGGTVRVSIDERPDRGRCAIVVEDSGPGISPDVEKRLFEPFFTTRATGTGVGLAVVRRVIDACRGRVEVSRGALGGACVALELEVAPFDQLE
jgi:PAS domain S-box-containing protein